jgi:hypothetical protein
VNSQVPLVVDRTSAAQHDVPAFAVAACLCIAVRPPLPSRVNELDDCAALPAGRKGQSSMAYRHNGGKPRSQTIPAFWRCPGLRPTGRLLRSARLSTSRYNRGPWALGTRCREPRRSWLAG